MAQVGRNEPIKKREIVKKREQELKHAIQHEMPQVKIEKAAERLRSAHLKLNKGIVEQFRYGQIRNPSAGAKPGDKAARELRKWENLSLDDIISMNR